MPVQRNDGAHFAKGVGSKRRNLITLAVPLLAQAYSRQAE